MFSQLTRIRASFSIAYFFPVGVDASLIFVYPLVYAVFCHQSGPLLKFWTASRISPKLVAPTNLTQAPHYSPI